jgi:hypothetical protein
VVSVKIDTCKNVNYSSCQADAGNCIPMIADLCRLWWLNWWATTAVRKSSLEKSSASGAQNWRQDGPLTSPILEKPPIT